MNGFTYVLLSTLIISVLWGAAAAYLYPKLRSGILALHPARRARILWGWSVAPLAMGLCLTFLLLIPYSPLSFSHGNHCSDHQNNGPHLSQIHLPLPEGASLPEMIVFPFLGWCALLLLFQFYTVCRGIQFRRSLRALCHGDILGAHLLKSNRPLAFSTGFLKPQVYISTSLVQGLSADQLRIVLAHEQAHVRHRDGLRLFLANAGAQLHFPRTRRLLLADLALAVEQACDEFATLASGDRLRVAEAILAVERLMQPHQAATRPVAACFFNNLSVARVQSLLVPDHPKDRIPLFISLPVITVLTALMSVKPLHHGIERLLRWLL